MRGEYHARKCCKKGQTASHGKKRLLHFVAESINFGFVLCDGVKAIMLDCCEIEKKRTVYSFTRMMCTTMDYIGYNKNNK